MTTSSVADDLERRLENWARWYWGGSVGAFSVGSIYGFSVETGHRRYTGASMPIINGEAIDTDTAIHRLDGPQVTGAPRPLSDVLRARYLRLAPAGYTMRTLSEIQVAAALYVSYDTYLRRLTKSKSALVDQLRQDSSGRSKIQA